MPKPTPNARPGDRIWVVADDNPAPVPAVAMLSAEGYRVRVSAGGSEVLSQIRVEPPDLILVAPRATTPPEGGIELCRRLRESESGRGIPVLFLSSSDADQERAQALAVGATDVLSEPCRSEELLARVRLHLEMSRLRRRLEARVVDGALAQIQADHRSVTASAAPAPPPASAYPRPDETILRAIVASTRDAIVMIDGDGRVAFWNSAAERVFGWTETEMLGRDLHTVLAPAHCQDSARQGLDRFGRTGQGAALGKTVELRGLCKDGSAVPVELSLSSLQWGGQRYAVGIVREITERRRMEELLHQKEVRFRALVQYSSDAIGILDAEGRIVYRSPALSRLLGYFPEEVVGSSLFDHVHPDEADQARRDFLRVVATPRMTLRAEQRMRHKDGSWRYLESVLVNCLHHPAVQGVVFNLRDITERKQYEAELRQLSSQLMRLRDEESRRIARELHDSTAQKLAALSINLSLMRTLLSETHPGDFPPLNDAVELARDCVQEIRTMSFLLHPPLLDELGLADAVREYADGFAERSGIRVDLEIPENLDTLSKEVELTLFRILQESLSNIRRHSGSKTASIRLSQDERRIQIQVSDAGRGLPPGLADGSPSSELCRRGFGIASMRERLRLLGGQLELASQPGGTTLTATIPKGSDAGSI